MISPSVSCPMAPELQPEPCSNSCRPRTESTIRLLSSPKACPRLNTTTRSMTWKCWRSSERWKSGDTTWKARANLSRSGRTIRTWSTSGPPRNSTAGKPDGPSTYPASTSPSTTSQDGAWASLTPSPAAQTTDPASQTTQTTPSLVRNFSKSGPSKVSLSPVKNAPSSVTFARPSRMVNWMSVRGLTRRTLRQTLRLRLPPYIFLYLIIVLLSFHLFILISTLRSDPPVGPSGFHPSDPITFMHSSSGLYSIIVRYLFILFPEPSTACPRARPVYIQLLNTCYGFPQINSLWIPLTGQLPSP